MTTIDPTYVFVITKQRDASDSSKGWAELETTESGVSFVLAYRTREEAEARMRTLVPEGSDPWAYGGYRVEREVNRGFFRVS